MTMRRGRRLVCAAVAAALAATALFGAAGGARAGTGGSAGGAFRGVPKFFVALPDGDNFANVPGDTKAQVRDTFTGKLLLTLRPAGQDRFVSVSAAADDRTFVLGANPNLSPPAVPNASDWYLLRLSSTGTRATLHKLRVPNPTRDRVDSSSVSPDGRELALLGVKGPAEALWIYSVATGRLLHSWSGALNVAWDAYTTLSWTADGRQLAIGYTWYTTSREYLGVRMLPVARPGHSLLTDSRLVWSLPTFLNVPTKYPFTCAVDIRVVVSADGRRVLCGASSVFGTPPKPGTGPACPAVPPWLAVGFLAYPTSGANAPLTVFKQVTSCEVWSFDVMWTNAGGNKVIGFIQYGTPFTKNPPPTRFGVFGAGKFSKLPMPPTTATVPDTIAW
jgi:hypothetical protein